MLRGTTIFKCNNCKKKFKGLDIEYNCTSLSNPQRCPYCGSFHTMPSGCGNFYRSTYETIWKRMDESGEHEVTCFYEQDKLTESIDECNEWNEQDEESKAADEVKNKERSSKDELSFFDYLLIVILLIVSSFSDLLDSIKSVFNRNNGLP